MNTPPAREKLVFGEKVVLYLSGGAGLLVWAVVLLLAINGRGAPSGEKDPPPPLVRALATLTPTPFPLPVDTPTPLPTWTPAPSPTPTLTPTPTPLPAGVPMLPIDGDIQVIALLGIDQGHNSAVWRTDSIILAFVDRKGKRLSLLSIPRDLWVHIPGYADNRINTVDALGERTHYPGGGPALLDKTLRFNLGIPVHRYIRLDFQGFVDIIDALGGITVDVTSPLSDDFPDPTSPSGWVWVTLPKGPKHMDGRMALTYCRSRVSTNDFDRNSRQQQVLFAVWKKALTVETLAQAPQLWAEFSTSFETDLAMTEAIQLATFVHGLAPAQVKSQSLDYHFVREWTTPDGAQVLLPQTQEIRHAALVLVSSGQ